MRERCCRCHITLTSEDKHWYGGNCEICEEDAWYIEHFDYLPFRATLRYVGYQLRWLRFGIFALASLSLRVVLRRLDARRQFPNTRKGR